MFERRLALLATVTLTAVALPTLASAHTTEICWRAEADGSRTFFAGTYHPGTTIYGSLVVDGVAHTFTGQTASLPADVVDCQPRSCGAPIPIRWQIVNVPGLEAGDHSLTTSCTSHTECPLFGCYPQTVNFPCLDDSDGDTICGADDNCPDVANPDQEDIDGDGVGDVCDVCPASTTNVDHDGDAVCDDIDNCLGTANADQSDGDGDGVGDVCDICPDSSFNQDADGDSVCDDTDNCPEASNANQNDTDGDGEGDACDRCPLDADTDDCGCRADEPDDDGDGVCTRLDACPGTVLPEDVPEDRLLVNHFADIDGDGVFETTPPNGTGPQRHYTMEDTAGCSCSQIIDELGIGKGHEKHGCSVGTMDRWVRMVNGGGCTISSSPSPAPWYVLFLLAPLYVLRRRRSAAAP